MHKVKALWASVALAAAVAFSAGCGGSLAKDMEKLAEEACACKDAECAKGVNEKLEKLIKNAKEPPKEDQEKIIASIMKAGECLAKLQGAGGAEAPPTAE